MSVKQDDNAPPKRVMISQTDMPNYPLDQALKIANALWDHYAGKATAPHNVALALGLSPTSGGWRNLCGASIGYGLTEGGYAAATISLTDLGRRIVAPTEEGGERQGLREAALRPRIQREFFTRYDKAKLPREDIAANVLVEMGMPKARSAELTNMLRQNGEFVGFIHQTKTGPYVALEGTTPPVSGNSADEETVVRQADDDVPPVVQVPETGGSLPRSPSAGARRLFIAHGKNTKPLGELKKILDQFKIAYAVAVDEPHKGRPISKKVAELMRDSSAGIFIFTKDTEFSDKDGNEVWRPSENVVYELGAANVLWENKIIILREDGVNFPSDFSDLGYITFQADHLGEKAIDILKELVGLDLVKIQAT